MSSLEIRPAIICEQRMLFALHEELFRKEIEQIWGWNDESQWRNFLTEWETSDTFVISRQGFLLGCLQYFIRSDHLYLFNLAIGTKFQNQGVGSDVLSWLKTKARNRELGIELKVFRTNPRVLNLYLRHGFEIAEDIETGFRLRWSHRLSDHEV